MFSPRPIADSMSTLDRWISCSEASDSVVASQNNSKHETASKVSYSNHDYTNSHSNFEKFILSDGDEDCTIEDPIPSDMDLTSEYKDSAMSICGAHLLVGFTHHPISCIYSGNDLGHSSSKHQSQHQEEWTDSLGKESLECQLLNWYDPLVYEKYNEETSYQILSLDCPRETLGSWKIVEIGTEYGEASSTLDDLVITNEPSAAKPTTDTLETSIWHIPAEHSAKFQSDTCSSVALLASRPRLPFKRSAALPLLLCLPMELLLEVVKYLEPCAWACLGLTCTFFYNQFRENYGQPVSLVTPLQPDNTSRFQWKLWHLLVGFMAPDFLYDPMYMIFRPRSRAGTRLSAEENKLFWRGRTLFDRLSIVNEEASRATRFNKAGIVWTGEPSDFDDFNGE